MSVEPGEDSITPPPSDNEFWHLKLYVAGQSPKSLRAFNNLKSMCEEYLAGRYEIEIVDLIEASLPVADSTERTETTHTETEHSETTTETHSEESRA